MAESSTLPSPLVIMGFHALSDPLRLQVIEFLRHQELCVCDLCTALDVAQSKLSFHLKILKEAQLVQTRQEGRWIYYRLQPSQFTILEQYLSELGQCQVTLPTRFCRED